VSACSPGATGVECLPCVPCSIWKDADPDMPILRRRPRRGAISTDPEASGQCIHGHELKTMAAIQLATNV